jgi:hypothetical protein
MDQLEVFFVGAIESYGWYVALISMPIDNVFAARGSH